MFHQIITFSIGLFKASDPLSLLISSSFIHTLLLVFLVFVTLLLPTYFIKQENVLTIVNKIKKNKSQELIGSDPQSSSNSLVRRFYFALSAGIIVVFIGALTATEWQLIDLLVKDTSLVIPGRSPKLKIILELILFMTCLYLHKKSQNIVNFPVLQAQSLVFCHFTIFLALLKGYVFNFVDLVCLSLLASIIASSIAHLKHPRQRAPTEAEAKTLKTSTVTKQAYLAWYYLFLVLSKILFWFFLYNSYIYAPQQDNNDPMSFFASALHIEGFYFLFFVFAICWLCVALRFIYMARNYSSTAINTLVPIPSEFFILYLWQVDPLLRILAGTFRANKLNNPGPGFKAWFKNVSLTLWDPVEILFLPNSLDAFHNIVIASGKESFLKIASLSVSAIVGRSYRWRRNSWRLSECSPTRRAKS